MRVFGLTGGIASGKSTVANELIERGIPVFDADAAAREVVEPGQPALADIVDAFGVEVLRKDGRLDRKALGAIVFADDEARARLEAITHPRIRERIGEQVLSAAADGHDVAFVDAALMVETGWYEQFAGLVVVWCPVATQLERLMTRDEIDAEAARARIDAQMPIDEKREKADFVVDNSGSLDELDAQIDALVAWLQQTATPA